MHKPAFLAALGAVLLLPAAVVQGQQRPPASANGQLDPCLAAAGAIGRSATPVALLMVGFDSDGDAHLSRAELAAGIADQFKRADSDGDGQLGLIELASWSRTWLGSENVKPGRFDFDRNADDRISAEEFQTELTRHFNLFDTDRDGSVTRAELLSIDPGKACASPEQGRRQRR